jgi:hypothetical protein
MALLTHRVQGYLQLLTCCMCMCCLCLQVLPQPGSLFRSKAALDTSSAKNIDQVSKVWQRQRVYWVAGKGTEILRQECCSSTVQL